MKLTFGSTSGVTAHELADDEGASAVEYALVVSAVAGLIAFVVYLFGVMVLQVNQDNCETIRATASPASSCS